MRKLWPMGFNKEAHLVGNVDRLQPTANPALNSIPIIAVTSYALSGDEERARAAGCDDFVPKPYSPRQLLAKVRQYLS